MCDAPSSYDALLRRYSRNVGQRPCNGPTLKRKFKTETAEVVTCRPLDMSLKAQTLFIFNISTKIIDLVKPFMNYFQNLHQKFDEKLIK